MIAITYLIKNTFLNYNNFRIFSKLFQLYQKDTVCMKLPNTSKFATLCADASRGIISLLFKIRIALFNEVTNSSGVRGLIN